MFHTLFCKNPTKNLPKGDTKIETFSKTNKQFTNKLRDSTPIKMSIYNTAVRAAWFTRGRQKVFAGPLLRGAAGKAVVFVWNSSGLGAEPLVAASVGRQRGGSGSRSQWVPCGPAGSVSSVSASSPRGVYKCYFTFSSSAVLRILLSTIIHEYYATLGTQC